MARHLHRGQVPGGNAATSHDARNISFNDVLRNNIPRSIPTINNAEENIAGQDNVDEDYTVPENYITSSGRRTRSGVPVYTWANNTSAVQNTAQDNTAQDNTTQDNTAQNTTSAATDNLQGLPLFTEAPSTTCQSCESLVEQPSSGAFFQAHGYWHEWSNQCESERNRYQEAERIHDETRQINLRREQWYIDRNIEAYISQLPPDDRGGHFLENLRRVHITRNTRQGTARFHEPWIINNPFQSYYSWMVVNLENPVWRTRVEIPVVRAATLLQGRYYADFTPGSYIFQYQNQTGHGLGAIACPGIIVSSDFKFMGLIPRPMSSYVIRSRKLFPELMKLFISVLQLKAGKDHRALYPEFDSLVGMTSNHSALLFEDVWKYWVKVARSGNWPDQKVRNNFISRHQVRELAWLMTILKVERSGQNVAPHALEFLLVSATGCSLQNLAGLWERRLEEVSRRMLESGDSSQLFVYEGDPMTEDIHQFYSQPPFDGDPLNPNLRNLCTNFCSLPEYKRGIKLGLFQRANGESAQSGTSEN